MIHDNNSIGTNRFRYICFKGDQKNVQFFFFFLLLKFFEILQTILLYLIRLQLSEIVVDCFVCNV